MNNRGSNSNLLVTGATGLSGSIVVREFAKQNIPIRILVRSSEKARRLKRNINVEIFEGNMLSPDTLQTALNGVTKVLLISSAIEKMVETQETFIDAARSAGVRHIIKFSGRESGIGFNSQNFISTREHENIEDYLVNSGLQWTMLRPSQFMQTYLPGKPTGVNLKQNALILPLKNAMLSPVDLEDVAKVCMHLLTEDGHEGKVYEMTGPDAMSTDEVCEIISNIIGRKISYVRISLDEYKDALSNSGALSAERINSLLQLAKERSKCAESYVKLNTHKRFGIRPTNFAEFIYKNAAAFNEIKQQQKQFLFPVMLGLRE
jgi:uncharacterized protein YbjT (DUF2867 family)